MASLYVRYCIPTENRSLTTLVLLHLIAKPRYDTYRMSCRQTEWVCKTGDTLSAKEIEGAVNSLQDLLKPYHKGPDARTALDLSYCLSTKASAAAISTAKARFVKSNLNTAHVGVDSLRPGRADGRVYLTAAAASHVVKLFEGDTTKSGTVDGLKEYIQAAERTLFKKYHWGETESGTYEAPGVVTAPILVGPDHSDNMTKFIKLAPVEDFGPLNAEGGSPRSTMSTKLGRYLTARDGLLTGFHKIPSVALKAIQKSSYMPFKLAASIDPTRKDSQSDNVKQVFPHIAADALRTHVLQGPGDKGSLSLNEWAVLSKSMLARCQWTEDTLKKPLLPGSVWISRVSDTAPSAASREAFQLCTVDSKGEHLAVRPISREEVTAVLKQY